MVKRDFIPDEHSEQCALIRWWDMQARAKGLDTRLLMAIPNGGARNAVTGARLKAEGVRAGVPDLLLAIPRNGFHGLWLEMKREKGGSVSAGQKVMLSLLAAQGFAVWVCKGFKQAKLAIETYLGWEKPDHGQRRCLKQPEPWQKWGNDDE